MNKISNEVAQKNSFLHIVVSLKTITLIKLQFKTITSMTCFLQVALRGLDPVIVKRRGRGRQER